MKRVSKSLELWNLRWNKDKKGINVQRTELPFSTPCILKKWQKSSGDYIWQDLLAFNSILLFLQVCLLGARGLWKFTAARRTPETTSYWCSSWKAESFGLTKERLCLSVLYTPQNNISGLKFARAHAGWHLMLCRFLLPSNDPASKTTVIWRWRSTCFLHCWNLK